MNRQEFFESFKIFFAIFLCLLFVYLGTITDFYLYHDDYISQIWNKKGLDSLISGDIRRHPYAGWHNILGRPLGHSFVAISNHFVYSISDGSLVRLFSIILLSIFSFFTYKLFLKNYYDKFFSFFFIVSFSALPIFWITVYQVTGMYIIICCLYVILFMHLFDNYLNQKKLFSKKYKIYIYYIFTFFSFWLFYVGSRGDGTKLPEILLATISMIFFLFLLAKFLSIKKIIDEKPENLIIVILPLVFAYHIYAGAALFSFFYLILHIFSEKNFGKDHGISKGIKILSILLIPLITYFLAIKFFNPWTSVAEGRQYLIDFNIISKLEYYFNTVYPAIFEAWFSEANIDKGYKVVFFDEKYISFLSYSLSILVFIYLVVSLMKMQAKKTYIVYIFTIILLCLGITLSASLFVKNNYFIPLRLLIGHVAIIYFLITLIIYKIFQFDNLFGLFNISKSYKIISLFGLFLIICTSQFTIKKYITYPLKSEISYIRDVINNSQLEKNINNGKKIFIEIITYNQKYSLRKDQRLASPLALSAKNSGYLVYAVNSLVYEKIKSKSFLLNPYNYLGITEVVVKNNDNHIIKTSFLPWGKIIETSNDISNEKKLSKKLIEIYGNKKLKLNLKKNETYYIKIDMRTQRKKIISEYDEYSEKKYYTQIKNYINSINE